MQEEHYGGAWRNYL